MNVKFEAFDFTERAILSRRFDVTESTMAMQAATSFRIGFLGMARAQHKRRPGMNSFEPLSSLDAQNIAGVIYRLEPAPPMGERQTMLFTRVGT